MALGVLGGSLWGTWGAPSVIFWCSWDVVSSPGGHWGPQLGPKVSQGGLWGSLGHPVNTIYMIF